jgi:hypothetical protein
VVAAWYGPGTKKLRVPEVELTPVAVLYWWLGDGGLAKHFDKRPTGYLYTNSFPREHVARLADQLTGMGIPALALRCGGAQAHEWRIHLNRVGVTALLAYIGDCPVPFYTYKWEADVIHRRHHLDGSMAKLKARDFPR